MNQLKPFLKKFLLVYAFAVTIVLIYFVIKTLFPNTKEIELKSFNKPSDVTTKVITGDKKTMKKSNEENSETGFILLPGR